MHENHSPWLAQLKRTRPVETLTCSTIADVAIVGGGIAGISTAYFILKNTDKSVVLLESRQIAHGATGRNAGQVTSYFEKSLADMVEEFGFDQAVEAQRVMDVEARRLLESIFLETSIQVPFSQFIGYDGWVCDHEILNVLEDLKIRKDGGLDMHKLLVAEGFESEIIKHEKYNDLYTVVERRIVLDLLNTKDERYIAALPFLSGCMNSAIFTEELAGYLLYKYKDRFTLGEETHVESVVVGGDDVVLHTMTCTVEAKEVVLCTNGFEHFSLLTKDGNDIDTKFHHDVMGKVGFMAGYYENTSLPPTALIYNPRKDVVNNRYFPNVEKPFSRDDTTYFYVTRRADKKDGVDRNLICVGGPEFFLLDRMHYDKNMNYPQKVKDSIDDFISGTYVLAKDFKYDFHWHGLMGYTRNMMRLIGPEPCHPRLYYNLGCNGVGILPSVFGGDRVSKYLRGDDMTPMVFDPKDKRCIAG